jgi:hypothetical protein
MSDVIVVQVPPPVVVGVIPSGTPTPSRPPIYVTPGQGGAVGPRGLQGVQGASGYDQIISYHHVQGVASNTWNIEHNLNFYPNVTIMDSAGNIVEGEIVYVNQNTLRATFSAAFSGNAYLS